MARVAERVSDKRVLTLIRALLRAGVLEDGLVRPTDEGTPQGGPLSPLLSNLVLDELDQEIGTARPSILSLCRRLQHPRPQSSSRRPRHEQRLPIRDHPTAVAGQRVQECRGSARGA